jgi:thiol-disulfide isomerase/thioredoxin
MKSIRLNLALFTILFCTCSIGFCQKKTNDSFVLNGKINADFGTVNLHPLGDSIFYPKFFLEKKGAIKNGAFLISGTIQYPQGVCLNYQDSTRKFGLSDMFFLEKGIQKIVYNLDTKKVSEIKNSTMKEYLNEYKPLFKLIEEEKNALYNYYDSIRKTKNDSLLKIVIKYYDAKAPTIFYKYHCINLEYVSKHPNSYPVLWYLIGQVPWGYEPIYDSIYSKFSKEIKNTYAGLALKRWLENSRITKIGNPFPFVQLSSIEKKTARLNFKGSATYTLLDFWYSHCGPCIAQFPKLKKIYSTCRSKGFEIVGISVDMKKDVNDYANAIKKFDLTWQHYWDISGVESKRLGIGVYPSNFLLDKTGKIIAKNISPEELEVFLRKNLN